MESKFQAEEADGNSVSGHPQHRGGDSFDCAGRGQQCIGSPAIVLTVAQNGMK